MKIPLTDLTASEISAALDLKLFQGKQIFRWLHQKKVFDFEAMTDLSKALRARLAESCMAAQLTPAQVVESPSNGAKKILFRLVDNETIESVLLRDGDRVTLCLSSQVGCALRCRFCATGMSGYKRNLTAGEIVEQALHLLEDEEMGDRTPNIVYMGMGEPFQNYEAVAKSIGLLMSEEGLGIGARKITVSTVGDVPGIERFSQEDWQVRLSISLHAANDTVRSRLVPLNKRYPIHQLLDAVRAYSKQTGRQVTFEWVLLRGVNDGAKDAEELADIIGDLRASVNLIPYNPVPDAEFAPPSLRTCETFRNLLVERGINATLRKERGGDIDAACGQLRRARLQGEENRENQPAT